jgi:hypothetical protein
MKNILKFVADIFDKVMMTSEQRPHKNKRNAGDTADARNNFQYSFT